MTPLTRVLYAACVLLAAVTCASGTAGARAMHPQKAPTIKVVEGGWGDARVQDIEKVFNSAAGEILAFVPSRRELTIIVRHDESGPMTLYERGANGEFTVLIDVEDRRWSQYAYQFAHEIVHVLAMNEPRRSSPNKWFEESLGEAASLFALRRMAATWRTNPPYSNWKDYAPSLAKYAEQALDEKHRQLPANLTFVEWFEANEEQMRRNPYLREKDELIANQLLPLFEAGPQSWDAVTYLNLSRPNGAATFDDYLTDWESNAPGRHKDFIWDIADMFGLEEEDVDSE